MEEEAIYRRLIDLYYTTEKSIPLDINIVSRAIRARGHEVLIELILNEFFIKTAKGFKQKRIDAELKKYKDKSKKAQASAQARWNKGSSDTEVNANAMRTHNERNAKQEPITTNQEPINNKKEREKTSRFQKPTLDELTKHFIEKELTAADAVVEATKFFNYYESINWKVGKNRMSKWRNAATGWANRRGEYAKNNGNNGTGEKLNFDNTDWAKSTSQ